MGSPKFESMINLWPPFESREHEACQSHLQEARRQHIHQTHGGRIS
jgi:hypothetical protein